MDSGTVYVIVTDDYEPGIIGAYTRRESAEEVCREHNQDSWAQDYWYVEATELLIDWPGGLGYLA